MADPIPYVAAVELARQQMAALDRRAIRAIEAAVLAFAARIAGELAALDRGPLRAVAPVAAAGAVETQRAALAASYEILIGEAEQLETLLTRTVVAGTDVAFRDVLEIWQRAERAAVEQLGEEALLGAGATGNLTIVAAYESLAAERTWRTALRRYVDDAAAEINALVRAGLVSGIRPRELAARLRPYIEGADAFYEAFPTRDAAVAAMRLAEQRLPEDLRNAAAEIRWKSLRIARSEIQQATFEAARLHALADPLIDGGIWTRSPDRGPSARVPDICDALATNDFYGRGPGWYPITRIPPVPHPNCRCSITPTVRALDEAANPKRAPAQILTLDAAGVGHTTTVRQGEAIRAQLARLLAEAARALSPGELALLAQSQATGRDWLRRRGPLLTMVR